MTLERSESTNDAACRFDGIVTVHEIADLALVFEPEVNIVMLRRTLPAALVEEVDAIAEDPRFRCMLQTTPDADGRRALSDALDERPRLAEDAADWVEVLAELTDSARVGVRLARVDAPMCPRLHVDRVTLRVVCTYVGHATEFVANAHVDRRLLGHASGGVPDENSGLLLPTSRVRRAERGDVVLLKGEAWPDNLGRGAIHRSPTASITSPRVVMTLDPLS